MQRFELKSPDRGRLARPTSQRSLVGGVSDGEPTRLKNPHRIPASTKGKGAMDEFAYFHQMDITRRPRPGFRIPWRGWNLRRGTPTRESDFNAFPSLPAGRRVPARYVDVRQPDWSRHMGTNLATIVGDGSARMSRGGSMPQPADDQGEQRRADCNADSEAIPRGPGRNGFTSEHHRLRPSARRALGNRSRARPDMYLVALRRWCPADGCPPR